MDDKLLAIVSMLFVFSLITERLANFLKLWLPEDLDLLALFPKRRTAEYKALKMQKSITRDTKSSKLLKAYQVPKAGTAKMEKLLFVGNLKTEGQTPFEEKQREAKILFVNILIGFLVAAIVKIDIIYIFNNLSTVEELKNLIGWEGTPLYFTNLIGIPLTGLFLSFGSKFWHDVVDLIYETKRLRSRAVDPDVLTAGSGDAVLKQIEEKNIAETLLNKNLPFFRSLPGFVEAKVEKSHGANAETGYCIDVYLDDLTTLPPNRPEHIVDPESKKKIVIDYLEIASATMATGEGGKIRNARRLGSFGSLGAIVYKLNEDANQQYILTCYHVLKNDGHDFFSFKPLGGIHENIVGQDPAVAIATLAEGEINNLFDIGLARITDKGLVTDKNRFNRSRAVTDLDAEARTAVTILGAVTTVEKPGFIHQANRQGLTVKYGKRKHVFDDVIAISSIKNGKMVSPAAEGDSGSIIYTAQGEALGMILAVNKKYTFAMPVNSVMDYLGLQFA